ncbi:MAG: class I SAM-dependent methyltransferase [Planctomycetota bacterium]|nr:class I SAM-dependent methyltransferase [Planctomycetota bacterium]
MDRQTLGKLIRHPLRTARNVVAKLIVGPFKYGRGKDYDAEGYWSDRLSHHGLSLEGAGDEGLSEEENRQAYEAALGTLNRILEDEGIAIRGAEVLEIGVGTGFYTAWLASVGVARYLGIDITETLLPDLRRRFPAFEFLKRDVTTDPVEGTFDRVFMMDVVEHIVTAEKLRQAMETVHDCLVPGGVFVLSGVRRQAKRNLFYDRSWTCEDIVNAFPGGRLIRRVPYRGNDLLLVRREPGGGEDP